MLCSFFFFKQKTAYEMRISDWSSDVCSSDLQVGTKALEQFLELRHHEDQQQGADTDRHRDHAGRVEQCLLDLALQRFDAFLVGGDGIEHGVEIGRASCRERVCQYV